MVLYGSIIGCLCFLRLCLEVSNTRLGFLLQCCKGFTLGSYLGSLSLREGSFSNGFLQISVDDLLLHWLECFEGCSLSVKLLFHLSIVGILLGESQFLTLLSNFLGLCLGELLLCYHLRKVCVFQCALCRIEGFGCSNLIL